MPPEARISISHEADIVTARQQGRALASQLGFSRGDLALIATAISEVARNIVEYARRGEIHICLIQDGIRQGIMVVARDEGPGIASISLAMKDGYSTGGGLGLGLPGAKRLMDDLEVASEPGTGTTVTMRKWKA